MKIDEATALAILFTNLKRRKKVNSPLEIAKAAKFLTEFYSSQYDVAGAVGVHESVIRKWARLAGAPDELRQYVETGKIHPVAAFAIISAFADREQQLQIAQTVVGWKERDITKLVSLKKRNPDFSVEECKRKVTRDR